MSVDVSDDLLDEDLALGLGNDSTIGQDIALSPTTSLSGFGGALGSSSSANMHGNGHGGADKDLEAVRAKLSALDEEEAALLARQSEVDRQMSVVAASPPTSRTFLTLEEKADLDARSVYIGNVDYTATAEELEQYFHGCGGISRVTIQCDRFSGSPKGFAYIEFSDKEAAQTALSLDGTLFHGRQIKVSAKRTNIPGISTSDRVPRGGRGARSRGFRGGMMGGGVVYVPMPLNAAAAFGGGPMFGRGRGRGGRGRGRAAFFAPY